MGLSYQNACDTSRVKTPPPSGSAGGGSDASLGIYTKFSDNRSASPFAAIQALRLERYAMQSAARSVLSKERVAKCLRTPIASDVQIRKTPSKKQDTPALFSYSSVVVCGSVWHCPVCAAKISEKRKNEVAAAIATHNSRGGQVLLLTITLPHRLHQPLKLVADTLQKAYGRFTVSRTWRAFKKTSDLTGSVKAFEVTYGENGWHPHFHVLLFVGAGLDLEASTEILLNEWRRQVVKCGFDAPNHHGLTLENGDKAARYVGKWGLEHEVTKSHIKRSRTGLTPFDLLRLMTGTKESGVADVFDAAALFREYAKVFKGRKQLIWSQGLRDLLHLGEEKTDDELADLVDEDSTLFARLPLNLWRVILKQERRGQVLDVCHQGIEALMDYCIGLLEEAGELRET